jgi:hypothetical protein
MTESFGEGANVKAILAQTGDVNDDGENERGDGMATRLAKRHQR